jgi:Rrf2 family cysteine metabolism transcriptional repressor
MKLLTKDTDYAIRALLYLATRKKGEWVSSTEISTEDKIPLSYLRRILQVLKKEKYVDSKEGASGGLKLNKKPEKIEVIELIKLFQGELQLFDCMFRKKTCHNKNKCVLRKRVLGIEKIVIQEFTGISLRTLLNDMGVKK